MTPLSVERFTLHAVEVPVKGAQLAHGSARPYLVYSGSMEDIRTRVGKRVASLRKAAGLTQDDLAAKANVGRAFLSEVERGLKTPSLETLERLGAALRANVTSFIPDSGETPVRNKPSRPSPAEELARHIAVIAQEAPPDELKRFKHIATAFFAKHRPRRRRR